MSHKRIYTSPAILQTVPLEMEGELLGGSVINSNSKVETGGQTASDKDFGGSGFNHDWTED